MRGKVEHECDGCFCVHDIFNATEKKWESEPSKAAQKSNASDNDWDRITRCRAQTDRIGKMQHHVDDGLKSGIGIRSRDELFATAYTSSENFDANHYPIQSLPEE